MNENWTLETDGRNRFDITAEDGTRYSLVQMDGTWTLEGGGVTCEQFTRRNRWDALKRAMEILEANAKIDLPRSG